MTLNNEKDAIKQAVEAGWDAHQHAQFEIFPAVAPGGIHRNVQVADQFSLDLAFWQALGKARGWDEFPIIRRCALTREGVEQFKNKNGRPYQTGQILGESRDKKCWSVRWDGQKSTSAYAKTFIFELGNWKTLALRYFETLLSRGDMEAFWQSLP